MSEKKRVLMLATTAAMIEQFNKNNIDVLNEMGYAVDMIGNFQKGNPISVERLDSFKEWIEERGGHYYDYPATRSPFDIRNNGKAIKIATNLVKDKKYAFIHCHNPIGSVIGRIVAHKTGTPIIYTAHGLHFYKGAPIKNWMLYYPVEKFFSRWTDALLLINEEDFKLAQEKFHAKKEYLIPGIGIDCNNLFGLRIDREKKRKELGLNSEEFAFVTVGELIPRKNTESTIKALAKVKKADNAAYQHMQYLVCGKGPELENLKKLASQLEVTEHVKFLGFRNDVKEIVLACDAFIFMSHQEGLSVALMEAMALGKPIICSRIRGNVDLIIDGVDGRLVDDESGLYSHLIEFYQNPTAIKKYAENARRKAERYDSRLIREKIREVYREF